MRCASHHRKTNVQGGNLVQPQQRIDRESTVRADSFGKRSGILVRAAVQQEFDDGIKSQTHANQAGMLGLLALLMGFSFSMVLQRFDGRSSATIEESNAIGTAYLRIGLLPEPQAAQMYSLVFSYVDSRIAGGRVDLSETADREAVTARTLSLQS